MRSNLKPVLLLFGATGQIGTLIAENLRDNEVLELRVASRKQKKSAELAKQYGKSMYIDLDNSRSFSQALHGVNRLFLLTGYLV
ncbi:MAG: NmrA family NAD(P)-binding protein [Gammaproteobacteria bacterium]|nr:NmrA family NAD(P)-binding protein [Gammaproteobacteria bacterium]MCW5584149.1 NmrA family NAD(P)-binding protein [Gammaproteobacteria bacterium]